MEEPGTEHRLWMVGAVAVMRVEEKIQPLPTKVLVPDITLDQIEAQRPWIDPYFEQPDGLEPILRLSVHSFVVRSAGTVIVVDTCVGTDSSRGLEGDPAFLGRLADAIDGGLEAVDVVVCTHLHFDHVGWNTVDVDGAPVPTFPNARYLVTAAEMTELERDDHTAVLDRYIQPLIDADVLDVIDLDPDIGLGDGGVDDNGGRYRITDEVCLISTPGHTPGHVSVLISSASDEATGDRSTDAAHARVALITGDAFHTPLQFTHPELAAWRFDTDPARSTSTRESLLERFTETETVVFGTHFAPPTAGRLRAGDDGVWFEPV